MLNQGDLEVCPDMGLRVHRGAEEQVEGAGLACSGHSSGERGRWGEPDWAAVWLFAGTWCQQRLAVCFIVSQRPQWEHQDTEGEAGGSGASLESSHV